MPFIPGLRPLLDYQVAQCLLYAPGKLKIHTCVTIIQKIYMMLIYNTESHLV